MTPEEFRRHGHDLIDWLADHQAGRRSAARAVRQRTPGAVAAALPAAPPEQPEPFAAMLADLDRIVTPGLSLWQHPRFFGYFPANAEPAGDPRRPGEHRAGSARPVLAILPRHHRAGGGHHRTGFARWSGCPRPGAA